MVILKKLWILRAANDWTHKYGRKKQHFNYHKLCYLLLYFGIFHSKSVILLALCLYLEKNHFHKFSLSAFKMNDTVDFKDKCFVHF